MGRTIRTMYSLLVILTLTFTHAVPLTEQEVPGLDDDTGIATGKTNDLEAAKDLEEYLRRHGHGNGNVGYRPVSGFNAGYTGGYNNGGYNVYPYPGNPIAGYNYGGYGG